MHAEHDTTPHSVQARPGPNYVYWGGDNLYVNLTNRCSNSCTFCLRNFTDEVFGYDLRLNPADEPSAEQVTSASLQEISRQRPREFVFTGLGEPTLRLDTLLAVVRWAHERGLYTRLDTNGHAQVLYPGRDVLSELREAGLDAISVSLNAADRDTYEILCRPSLERAFEAVVDFVRRAVALGFAVTVTCVAVPQLDLDLMFDLARELGVPLRVRRLITPKRQNGNTNSSDRES